MGAGLPRLLLLAALLALAAGDSDDVKTKEEAQKKRDKEAADNKLDIDDLRHDLHGVEALLRNTISARNALADRLVEVQRRQLVAESDKYRRQLRVRQLTEAVTSQNQLLGEARERVLATQRPYREQMDQMIKSRVSSVINDANVEAARIRKEGMQQVERLKKDTEVEITSVKSQAYRENMRTVSNLKASQKAAEERRHNLGMRAQNGDTNNVGAAPSRFDDGKPKVQTASLESTAETLSVLQWQVHDLAEQEVLHKQ